MSHYLFLGPRLVRAGEEIPEGYLLLEDGEIRAFGPLDALRTERLVSDSARKVVDLRGSRLTVIPGMIDMHIHGAYGADVMDATPEALRVIAEGLAKDGTTGFLATTMTAPPRDIEAALKNVRDEHERAKSATFGATLLGVHLEGPFLSPERAGAQSKAYMLPPDSALILNWQHLSGGLIRQVTFAPERAADDAFIKTLLNLGIVPSIGHSDAHHAEVVSAVRAGARQVTHLFNGMRPLHHRDPGVAGTALIEDDLTVELILDGVHWDLSLFKLVYRQKGIDKMLAITDAMRARGLGDGTYTLGGEIVHVEGKRATLGDGTLAGSVLSMQEAFQNAYRLGLPLSDVVRLTSTNAARQLGLSRKKGDIAVGYDADIVLLDGDYQVVATLVRGEVVYSAVGWLHG
ncbi:MAG: N-acetylglucosamine-6-phosphate deacetylase [Candidatus Carbobacillus altaicus]|nr:N-acetylglucosamine-6-phosphate deacetylase [Candidatus Carbobacillus altaicus]